MEEIKVCSECKKEKKIYDFEIRNDNQKRRGVCKRCRLNQHNARLYKKRRENGYVHDPSKVKPWNKADVVYFSKTKNYGRDLDPLVFVFCKWCRCEITKENTEPKHFKNGYCGEWCREVDNPLKLHVCNGCNDVVYAHTRRDGISSGVYPKYCEQCQLVGRHINNRGRKPKNEIHSRRFNKEVRAVS